MADAAASELVDTVDRPERQGDDDAAHGLDQDAAGLSDPD